MIAIPEEFHNSKAEFMIAIFEVIHNSKAEIMIAIPEATHKPESLVGDFSQFSIYP